MADVLVLGGAGYIGSHCCVELINAGHSVVVLDNFANSVPTALTRAETITHTNIPRINADIRDTNAVARALRDHACDTVMHFAGLKAVGESTTIPIEYYDVNVVGTVSVLKAMQLVGVNRLIFSSSATVYGRPEHLPITEVHPTRATNPYGRTKLMIEEILQDLFDAAPDWRIARLRYFNPCGAHGSGLIGEDPKGMPNNLVPFIAQVAAGLRPELRIWGTDYATKDGTGVRDYIHVVDLALGHVRALDYLQSQSGMITVNLGTGHGYSVKEMLHSFRTASGRDIPFTNADRRPGDVASCYADPSLAQSILGWRAERTLQDMCRDHWNWQKSNPRGYD